MKYIINILLIAMIILTTIAITKYMTTNQIIYAMRIDNIKTIDNNTLEVDIEVNGQINIYEYNQEV